MRNPREAGASLSLAGDSGSSTPQTGETQLDPVRVFAPWAGAEERALRLRIRKAHTIATGRATHEKNGRACVAYWLAAELAGAWVFRHSKDLGDLERILWALNQLFMAAGHIAQVEGHDGD